MKYLFLIIVFLVTSNKSFSCLCSGASDYAMNERSIEWWNDSPIIVKAILDSTQTKETKYQILFFTVTKIYKGMVAEKISFNSPLFNTSCKWDLRKSVKSEFILYAKLDEKGLITTHFCDGSKELLSQKELDAMDPKDFIKKIFKQELDFIKVIDKSENGFVKTYYSNGKLTGKGKFQNGIPIGHWKYFSYDGLLISEGAYENGLKNGIWKVYYSTAFLDIYYDKTETIKKYWQGQYMNGLREGVWNLLLIDGTIVKTVTFTNDKIESK